MQIQDRIIRYVTASGSTPDQLDADVEHKLRQGLQPHGNPYAVTDSMTATSLFQAMVEYFNPNPANA